MRNSLLKIVILILSIIGFTSCTEKKEVFENKEFCNYLNSYLQYLDSINDSNKEFDYICIQSKTKKDTTFLTIHLSGGAYRFISYKSEVIDFINYKTYKVLLIGEFPNKVLEINKNNHLDITKDILLKYYRKEYEKFLESSSPIPPLIYDYMTMYLIFKNDKLLSCKREYY